MKLALVALAASLAGCVEPSQARVTETPEELLNNDDCAAYKPVKGVMPGASPTAKSAAEGEAKPPVSDARCTGAPAK